MGTGGGPWGAQFEEHTTLDLGVELEPHVGCGDYLHKNLKKKKR